MAHMWRAGLGILGAEIRSTVHFRANLLAWILFSPLQLAVVYLLWDLIYSRVEKVGDFAFRDILLYYLVLHFLRRVLDPVQEVTYKVWSEINGGTLDSYLARPVRYGPLLFWRSLGEPLVEAAIGLPFFLIFAAVLELRIVTGPTILALFALSVLGGFVILFLLQFLLGVCTFWIERIFGLRDVVVSLFMLFSGQLLPVSVLPEPLARLSPYLPFQYVYFAPARIYQSGDTALAAELLLQGAGWVFLLCLASIAVWSRGVVRYSSQGG